MPIFNYTARDLQGIDHQGSIETVDLHQVAKLLGKKGLVVIDIKQKRDSQDRFFNQLFHRISFADLVVMTRQLATMIESGLVLSEALDILVEQQTNKRFKAVLGEISRDIKSGVDLASALSKHPDVFPSVYASLVKAGEQAGKLDVVLSQMANSLERDREFRARIRGAMIYPVIIIIMMVIVMMIMLFFVIPRLTALYQQSNIELPLPTKILIGTSSFFVSWWWMILILVVVAIISFRRWLSNPANKFTFDELLLRVPVVGKIIQDTALTNFTRTFALLTTAGVPLLDSLNIVGEVTGNMVYRRALQVSFRGVERGLTFSSQLEAIGVFPSIVHEMIRVGEETGKVDKVTFKLSEYFETEADHMLKNLTVIIEPVILVILGVGVAMLILSIILPIYKLTTSIS